MIPYVLVLIAFAIFALALVPRRRKKSGASPLGLWIARDAIDDGATLTIPNRVAGGAALTGTGPTRPTKRVEIFDAIGRIDEISPRVSVTPLVVGVNGPCPTCEQLEAASRNVDEALRGLGHTVVGPVEIPMDAPQSSTHVACDEAFWASLAEILRREAALDTATFPRRAPIAPTSVVIAPAWDDDETPVGKVEVIR